MITLHSTFVIMLIRTQISLHKQDYEVAKQEAKRLGISLAEFFRKALQKVLPAKGKAPWMKYCGMIETGSKKSSQEIDEIVYGQKD